MLYNNLQRIICLISTVFLAALTPSAVAQQFSGSADRYYEDQIQSVPVPLSRPLVDEPTLNQDPAEATENDTTVFVKKVKILGRKHIPIKVIENAVNPYLNKPLTLLQINQLASAASAAVVDAGYIISRVTIPAQDLQQGVLRLKVSEVGLSEVTFSGDKLVNDSALTKRWRQILLEDQPLQQKNLERVLLTINAAAGVRAKGTLYKLENGLGLKISTDRDQVEGFLSIDNRGSEFVGRWQGSAIGRVNGVLGITDQLSFRSTLANPSAELKAVDLTYTTLLNAQGTTLTVNGLRVWSEPGHTLKPNRLESINNRVMTELTHPLIRQRSQNVFINSGITVRNNSTKTFGAQLTEDRTRAVHIGLRADKADRFRGISLVNITYHQGFDTFGAIDNDSAFKSRANGRSDFSKVEAYVSRTQDLSYFGLPYGFSLLAAAEGQYAFTQLLSPEEFGYGGAQFGRGYDSSELVGDHGFSALAELQYTPTSFASSSGLQLYASYDAGIVWAIDTNTRFESQTAASAAIGLRTRLFENVSLDVQASKPLTRPVSAKLDNAKALRAFMQLSWQF